MYFTEKKKLVKLGWLKINLEVQNKYYAMSYYVFTTFLVMWFKDIKLIVLVFEILQKQSYMTLISSLLKCSSCWR